MSKNSTRSNSQPDSLFKKFSNNISCSFVNLSNNSDKSVDSRTISDFSEGKFASQYLYILSISSNNFFLNLHVNINLVFNDFFDLTLCLISSITFGFILCKNVFSSFFLFPSIL